MWKTVKLGDVCLVRRGTTITKKQTVEGIIPVIGGGTKPTYYHNQANREANCITVSGSGASAGFVNKWEQEIFASDCSTVEPQDENQLHQFVYYYLLSQQQYIYDNFRSGAAQPHVYAKDIATLPFPVIPLAEQQRIVAKLDAAFAEIDRAIESTNESIKNSLSLRVSVLSAVTERNGSDTTTQKLGDLFKLSSGKFLPKKEMNTDGSIKVIGGNGIAGSHDETNLSGKNVVIGRVGAKCGNVHFFDEDIWLTDNAMYVHSFLFEFDEEFLAQALTSLNLGAYARQAAQPVISFSSIKDVPLAFPLSVSEQREIVSKYNEIQALTESLIETRSRQMIELNCLKSAILAQALKPSEAA